MHSTHYLTRALCIIFFSLAIGGCVSSKSVETETIYHHTTDNYSFRVVNSANVKEKDIKTFKKKLTKQLTKEGLYNPESNRILEVRFTKHYSKSRYMYALSILTLGIASEIWPDKIHSTVKIKDARNNQHEGIIKVKSKNFWLVRPSFILFNDHAVEIVEHIKHIK